MITILLNILLFAISIGLCLYGVYRIYSFKDILGLIVGALYLGVGIALFSLYLTGLFHILIS